MKTCFKCSAEKPLSEFYRHAQMADGHLNKCKECAKRDTVKNRNTKLEYYRAYDRQRANQPNRLAARLDYQQTERGKAASRKGSLAYDERYPNRKRASTQLSNAIRDGRVKRLPCEVCGAEDAEGHHVSYDLPLTVTWLCTKHHSQLHRDFRQLCRQNHFKELS